MKFHELAHYVEEGYKVSIRATPIKGHGGNMPGVVASFCPHCGMLLWQPKKILDGESVVLYTHDYCLAQSVDVWKQVTDQLGDPDTMW